MPLSSSVTDLTAEVARICRDSGITAVDEQDYIDALNNAQDLLSELLRMFHTTYSFSTTSGLQYYDLPTGYMSAYARDSIVYTDSAGSTHDVYYTDYDSLRSYDDLSTKTGTPEYFWIQNNDIYFYPTPDYSGSSNATIEYYKYADSLTGGTLPLSDITWVYATYTVLSSDSIIFANGTFTITMLDATTCGSKEVTIKNVGAGIITIATTSSQVLDGDSSYVLYTQYGAVTFKSDGANWYIIRKV